MKVTPITHSNLIPQLMRALDLKIPLVLWGEPGIGKSSIIEQIALLRGMKCVSIYLSQMGHGDLHGVYVPDMETGKTLQYPPDFLPQEGCDPTLLFFDELGAAQEIIRKPATQLILEGWLGSYRLPDNCVVIAASNLGGEDGVLTFELDKATADRFTHLKVIPEYKHWKEVFVPAADIDQRVVHFLDHHTQYFCASMFEKDNPDIQSQAMDMQEIVPTPRAWAKVSRIIEGSLDPREYRPLVEGCLGTPTTTAFLAATMVEQGAVTARAILEADPKKRPGMLPASGRALMALSCSLAAGCRPNSVQDYVSALHVAGLIAKHKTQKSPVKEGEKQMWEEMAPTELGSSAADRIIRHAEKSLPEKLLAKMVNAEEAKPGIEILTANPFADMMGKKPGKAGKSAGANGKSDPQLQELQEATSAMNPGMDLMAAIRKQTETQQRRKGQAGKAGKSGSVSS